MKILFVDDEPRILQGITRSVFHLLDEWEVETAGSGPEALEILAEGGFQVLVTDMRMPGMDGAALLVRVHDEFPDVVRIVLSGHTELEAALRVVPVAHQFLTKPCDAEQLQAVIERALNLRALLSSESLRSLVGHVKSLPAVPRIYAKLTAMLADPDACIRDVSDLIESDPAMCVKVLQLVNSSFFSAARATTDVHRAVSRLGIRMVKNLALMVEVFSPRSVQGVSEAAMERQAQHGLRVGTLASHMVEGQIMKDDAFMSGLLHDIGKLVLWAEQPGLHEQVMQRMEESQLQEHEAEREILSASHAEVGGYLVGVWGLPYRIAEAVAFHHNPAVPHGDAIDLLSATHIANELLSGRAPSDEYLAAVGVTPGQLDAWRARASEIGGALGDAA
ncbi:MAG: response regulator [Myxococcales bacterium]|nr:response regulator [Myxococcales bacterium]MDD9966426.1 response regulator [Myxococcales bacterium]